MKAKPDILKYLHKYSNILVFEAFVFNITAENAIGLPYILIQCICKGRTGLGDSQSHSANSLA